MKKLFFTTTRPRHIYKSERFFRLYQRLRYFNFFGKNRANNHRTIYKRMLVLKRFIMWYYSFLGNRQFFRLMREVTNYTTGYQGVFIKFITLLELNLQVLLVRSNVVNNLLLAKNLIISGFVIVNGKKLMSQRVYLKKGDVIEILIWQIFRHLRSIFVNYNVLNKFKKTFFSFFKKLNCLYEHPSQKYKSLIKQNGKLKQPKRTQIVNI